MSNTQTTKVQLTIEVEVYNVIHTFVERFRTMSGRTLIVFVLGEKFYLGSARRWQSIYRALFRFPDVVSTTNEI